MFEKEPFHEYLLDKALLNHGTQSGYQKCSNLLENTHEKSTGEDLRQCSEELFG